MPGHRHHPPDHQRTYQHPGHGGAGAFSDPGRYARFSGLLARNLHRRVARDVAGASLPDDAFVLDVGTGPGVVPRLIARNGPGLRVEGVDLSPEMIAYARQQVSSSLGRPEYRVADVAALPFPEASVDLVISALSQHHWPDPAAGLAEIARVLRPGAEAWIYDFRSARPGVEQALGGLDLQIRGHARTARLLFFGTVDRLVLQRRP
jgi:ubiquinone/menaquinone biosynthesis C-methylase UbiE